MNNDNDNIQLWRKQFSFSININNGKTLPLLPLFFSSLCLEWIAQETAFFFF